MTTFSKGILLITFMISAVLVVIFLSDVPFEPTQKINNTVPEITFKSSRKSVPRPTALHAQANPVVEKSDITINIALTQGETLSVALASAKVPKKQIIAVSDSLKKVINLRKLMPGQKVELSLQEDGEKATYNLEKLTLVADTDRLIITKRTGLDKYQADFQEIDHSSKLVFASGEITNSFYASAKAEHVPKPILMDTFATLSHAIDFQRDISKGDRFVLGYEYFDDKEYGDKHPGDLLYVSMFLGEKEFSYFRYKTSNGFSGFFDAEGKSIDTSLLKTPLGGGRLSSLYGKRKHPVLAYARMHKGLDFAAAKGTPIFAAGDGIVTARKRNGSFGKYIRIKHNKDYSTAYAHLNKYAQNLAVGSRVRQGDIIGNVGTTGLTSGPNLHYEVVYRGQQINPLTVKLPSRIVLNGNELNRFKQAKKKLLSQYMPVPHTEYQMSKFNGLRAYDERG
jgi:murein DD-endopeptidase MepM/ murein hydrolase activator NlpD